MAHAFYFYQCCYLFMPVLFQNDFCPAFQKTVAEEYKLQRSTHYNEEEGKWLNGGEMNTAWDQLPILQDSQAVTDLILPPQLREKEST